MRLEMLGRGKEGRERRREGFRSSAVRTYRGKRSEFPSLPPSSPLLLLPPSPSLQLAVPPPFSTALVASSPSSPFLNHVSLTGQGKNCCWKSSSRFSLLLLFLSPPHSLCSCESMGQLISIAFCRPINIRGGFFDFKQPVFRTCAEKNLCSYFGQVGT